MGIALGSNFDVETALPLDARLVVADETARDAIDPLRRYEGMLVYVEADETNYQLVGGITNADWAELSGSGSGEGGINYITNGSFEDDTTGWGTYLESDLVSFTDAGDLVTCVGHGLSNGQTIAFASITSTTGISVATLYYVITATANTFQVALTSGGAAVTLTTDGSGLMRRDRPVVGSGGTATVAISRSGTDPLIGTGSGLLTKTAVFSMGQGYNYNFTIDSAYKAKVLEIEFHTILNSGTFAAGSSNISPGDIRIWIYDVTNSVLIQPSTIFIGSQSTTVPFQFNSTFQTSSNSTSYRLIVHYGSVSASANELKIDGVKVSPSKYVYGTPITDWQAYTPAPVGFGSPSSVALEWRRAGSDLDLRGSFVSGTSTATEARVPFPTGLVAAATFSGQQFAGNYARNANEASYMIMIREPSVSYLTFGKSTGSTTGLTKLNGDAIVASGTTVSFRASVPIAGWSSSVQISDNAAQRVVAMRASGNPPSANSGNPFIFPTVDYDTHGAYNASTGLWTAPIPGFVRVSGFLNNAASGVDIEIFVNGSSSARVGLSNYLTWNGSVKVNAGDTVSVRPVGGAVDGNPGYLFIEMVQGPQTIGAIETILARAVGNPASASSGNPVIWPTISFDTHGGYNATTGRFTCPASGYYRVSGYISSANTAVSLQIYKDAVADVSAGQTDSNGECNFIGISSCVAGQILDLRPGGTLDVGTDGAIYFERIK